jgi:hypothetical protein
VKLQHGKCQQRSDEEVELEDDDYNDDDEEEEEDNIPWDELARDDEGLSSQLTAPAQVPPGSTPAPA